MIQRITVDSKQEEERQTLHNNKIHTIYFSVSVMSQIFMLTWAVEVAFIPELYHVFSD